MNIEQKKFYCIGKLSDDVLKYLLAKDNGSDTLYTLKIAVEVGAAIIVDTHGRVTCATLGEECDLLNTTYIRLNLLDFLNLCDVPSNLVSDAIIKSLLDEDTIKSFIQNRGDICIDLIDSPEISTAIDRLHLSKYIPFFK